MTDSTKIARLAIALDYVKPAVRRQIEVPIAFDLYSLHLVFQIAIGWDDDHLYEFSVGRDILDEEATLAELLARAARKKTFTYLYDFGDSWRHTVKLVGVVDAKPGVAYPRLVSARGRCPPENVGGAWGYAEFLEAIADPGHERHEEMVAWHASGFDPLTVDEAAIHKKLSHLAA